MSSSREKGKDNLKEYQEVKMLRKLNVGLVGTHQSNFIVSLALKGLEESIQAMEKLAKESEFNF